MVVQMRKIGTSNCAKSGCDGVNALHPVTESRHSVLGLFLDVIYVFDKFELHLRGDQTDKDGFRFDRREESHPGSNMMGMHRVPVRVSHDVEN